MTVSIPSEGRDINLKRLKSFKVKLWLYFVLFTAIIFSVLWLLQTVFLQGFYDAMLIRNTKTAAQQIVEHSNQSDINRLIDELTHDNSFLVYITDTQGNIYYSADEYKAGHIPGAVLLTMETITEETATKVLPDKNQMILIYCRSGRRSKIAAQNLLDLGYTNLIEFGGILDYKGTVEK